MAGASLLTLIDDIASLLDDVAVLSKVAVQKTAGVLGDDLALNAQQLTGVNPKRELPVVLAVAKGSIVNKAILVPVALAISAWLPWAVTPLLMIGGAYLCYEGCEKLLHKFLPGSHEDADAHAHRAAATADPAVDMVAFEKQKIAGAVRTDFILSAEIIVIALGTVAQVGLWQRIAVLIAIAVVMTVGVYGLVAAIIKLDDLGLSLCRRPGRSWWRSGQRGLGRVILAIAPYLLKLLSIAGTAAMFIVGGGILTHGIAPVHHFVAHAADAVATSLPASVAAWLPASLAAWLPASSVGWFLGGLTSILLDAAFGMLIGSLILAALQLAKR